MGLALTGLERGERGRAVVGKYAPRAVGAWQVAQSSVREFLGDDLPTYACAVAFQALFSLFPFALFLVALLGFLQLDSFFEWAQRMAATMVPAQAVDLIANVLAGLQVQQRGLLSFGVISALWTASAGVRVVMDAMNVAYGVAESRPAWKIYVLSLIYTLGIAAMILAAAVLLILGPRAVNWVAGELGLKDVFVAVWIWVRWPAALLLMILALALTYHFAPNVEHRFRLLTPGAIVALAVWIAASAGFGYYVRNLADYNAVYGSIGAVIVLLFYLYLSAAALLFGAEINAVIERSARRARLAGPANGGITNG